MKTLMKTLTLISLMLSGGVGLMGQKSFLLHDIQPLMTYSSESISALIVSAENNSDNSRLYPEEKTEVKDWMVNQEGWLAKGPSDLASASLLETEKELEVEEWMISSFQTGDQWFSNLVKEQTEPPLQLQDWMLCCKEWQAKSL